MAILDNMRNIFLRKKVWNTTTSSKIPWSTTRKPVTSTKDNVESILEQKEFSERRDLSLTNLLNRNKFALERAEENNKRLQATIDEQELIIDKSSRTSKKMILVSIAVSSIISWIGVSIYGQIDPESSLQSFVSDSGKSFLDQKTGYELIQEGKKAILIKTQLEWKNTILGKENQLLENLKSLYESEIEALKQPSTEGNISLPSKKP